MANPAAPVHVDREHFCTDAPLRIPRARVDFMRPALSNLLGDAELGLMRWSLSTRSSGTQLDEPEPDQSTDHAWVLILATSHPYTHYLDLSLQPIHETVTVLAVSHDIL